MRRDCRFDFVRVCSAQKQEAEKMNPTKSVPADAELKEKLTKDQ